MKNFFVATALGLAVLCGTAFAGETPSSPGTKVAFDGLKDGDKVKSPVAVKFKLEGMEVAPAGEEKPNSGHHHVLIDRPPLGEGADGKEEVNANIPKDDKHLHFGKGETEASLELAPGTHTLQLVLGDKDHIPHNPPVVSEVITITVE